jgi:hypothetical protein
MAECAVYHEDLHVFEQHGAEGCARIHGIAQFFGCELAVPHRRHNEKLAIAFALVFENCRNY